MPPGTLLKGIVRLYKRNVVMDYEKLMHKSNPFEDLSLEERKRLFVYMCHVAHPSCSADEINQKWGSVLSQSDMPTVF